jgi:hypothetical protein
MAAKAADERLVVDNLPSNRIERHFCHPTLNFPARVILLPVKALAAPYGAGNVVTVRR